MRRSVRRSPPAGSAEASALGAGSAEAASGAALASALGAAVIPSGALVGCCAAATLAVALGAAGSSGCRPGLANAYQSPPPPPAIAKAIPRPTASAAAVESCFFGAGAIGGAIAKFGCDIDGADAIIGRGGVGAEGPNATPAGVGLIGMGVIWCGDAGIGVIGVIPIGDDGSCPRCIGDAGIGVPGVIPIGCETFIPGGPVSAIGPTASSRSAPTAFAPDAPPGRTRFRAPSAAPAGRRARAPARTIATLAERKRCSCSRLHAQANHASKRGPTCGARREGGVSGS